MTCPGAVHRRIRNSRQRFGRKWLVTTTSATEAAGCVLWEEQGNVENNAAPRRSSPCATCATRARSKGSDARWEWAGKVQIFKCASELVFDCMGWTAVAGRRRATVYCTKGSVSYFELVFFMLFFWSITVPEKP